ncbi:corticotropin-releasing factor-binding protein isoform X2 [Aethina tumida]|uniref:corticotropin-releasing factor-binding protein isoform X2 n=1 Tax=Aethina tumida TaxID=116153 RepID=UPI00096B2296|nr:corticotropin-releasing factor-binding protein isoform X2 [Aethina tumida]
MTPSLKAVLSVATLLAVSIAFTAGLPKMAGQHQEVALRPRFAQLFQGNNLPTRSKRTVGEFHIPESECIYMTSQEGEFTHKAMNPEGNACGVFIGSEPDQIIEIRFNYLDVPCENGGLIAVVDGWELNGEFFPQFDDTHTKPRFTEICGERKVKTRFYSSQNAALIQYRMPKRGTSFSFTVKFHKNPTPCNVMFQEVDDIYTIRNYGRRSNCSLSTVFPAIVKIVAIDVGVTPSAGRGLELETGTIHKCQKRGLEDYVQIGGSTGLDTSKMEITESVCGLNSKPEHREEAIACETTTVRLVSSGAFDNSVTVNLRKLEEDHLKDGFLNLVCGLEDLK